MFNMYNTLGNEQSTPGGQKIPVENGTITFNPYGDTDPNEAAKLQLEALEQQTQDRNRNEVSIKTHFQYAFDSYKLFR